MSRLLSAFLISAAAVATVTAGPIPIGGANGLTNTYVTGGSCTGAGLGQVGFTGCYAGNGGAGLRGYNNVLFTAPTYNGNPIAPPAPTSGKLVDNTTDNAVFNLINDPSGNSYWATTGASGTITIPIGIFGVTNAWTMLNDYWGGTSNNTTVRFIFSSDSAGTTGVVTDDIALNNNAQIRASVDCTAGTAGHPCPVVNANGQNIPTSISNVATTIGDATVRSGNLFSSKYNGVNSVGNASTWYAGTSGNVVLDDQEFSFGSAHAGQWLAAIQIVNSGAGTNISRDALSAITVDAEVNAAVPEPSTIMLLMAGLGSIGLARIRRRK